MPFTFTRSASTVTDPEGRILSTDAYSGHGDGLNNPLWEAVLNAGPIPAGRWHIGAPKAPVDHLGPLAMPLTPMDGTDPQGRRALFIHGDNAAMDHTASDGCVILCRAARQVIADAVGTEDGVLIVE